MTSTPSRHPYSTDLTDDQWDLIRPFLPEAVYARRPLKTDRREVVNAILYLLKTGCQWRMLPHDFGIPWRTVYEYFARYTRDGVWERLQQALIAPTRVACGRDPEPSLGIIDSQTVKGAETTDGSGYDGGKQIRGRKRHLVVDVLGLILVLHVTAADVTDAKAAEAVFRHPRLAGSERLKVVLADQGYHRHALYGAMERADYGFELQIAKGLGTGHGFQVIPKRWIVERTNSWVRGVRRLAKDYERRIDSAKSFIYLRSSILMANQIIRKRVPEPNPLATAA